MQDQSKIDLLEIDVSYIKDFFPHLYHAETKYFSIVKNENHTGIYGIVDRKKGKCEVFLTIFKNFRNKTLNKYLIHDMIVKPIQYGYREIWTWTKLRSWQILLEHFSKEGVNKSNLPPWDQDSSKIWYKKKV